MSSRIRSNSVKKFRHFFGFALISSFCHTSTADLLLPPNSVDVSIEDVANVSPQILTDVYSQCVQDAIQREEASNLLGLVTVLDLRSYCQVSRDRLAVKTSVLTTSTFEAVILSRYYLIKAGELLDSIVPVDKIIDLE